MKILKCAFIFLLAFSSLQSSAQNEVSDSTALRSLATFMTGSFSSAEQAEEDTSYYSISLEMHEIWESNNDTIWLYVEQALTSKKEKPYRVRVYRLTYFDNLFESAVYRIPEEENYYGQWENDSLFAELNLDSLQVREGCAVFLEKESDGSYSGSTYKKECLSSMRGASYATSEVEVFYDRISSWDRGFDDNDEHVWGAEDGPYVFKKERKIMRRTDRPSLGGNQLPNKKTLIKQK